MSSADATPVFAIRVAIAGILLMLAGAAAMIFMAVFQNATGAIYGDEPILALLAALSGLCFIIGAPLALLSGLWILARLAIRQRGVRSE